MSSYVVKYPIVQHYAGSIACGTNLPTSDVDIRGLFCATQKEVQTPFFPVKEVNIPGAEDGKLYELSKFIELYTGGNPNILETLWVDGIDIIETSMVYQYLRQFRSQLLSSKVAFTFSGYALSQLKRIKGHKKWLNNPQDKEPPKHKDYLKMIQNFTDKKIMPRDFNLEDLIPFDIVHYGGNIFGAIRKGRGNIPVTNDGDFNISVKQVETSSRFEYDSPLIIFKYLPDEYNLAKEKHHNYWTWKKNRNEKRAGPEAKFGYCPKHAMHLVRLLRMGEEILSGQGVIVKRFDAKELLEIRGGKWTYDELLSYAEEKDQYIRGELYKNTELRRKPDIKLAANVLLECQKMCWESELGTKTPDLRKSYQDYMNTGMARVDLKGKL